MINVNGYIKNNAGQPVPFASLGIYDGDLNYTGEGTAANAGGYFSFYVNEENEPYMLQASSAGYKSLGVKLSTFTNGSAITLQPNIITNQGVTVYSNQKNKLPLWLALFPLLAIVADKKKGSKISGIKNIYTGLPPWARGAVIVGSGFVAYNVLNKILKRVPDKEEPQNAGNEVNVLSNQGIFPTYTNAQYEGFSNSIVQAIWDCGTDEAAIYNVMRAMRNEADIYKLINVYGLRKYKGCFENPFSLVERSLSGAISSELSEGEKSEVNDILKQRGIKFQFA